MSVEGTEYSEVQASRETFYLAEVQTKQNAYFIDINRGAPPSMRTEGVCVDVCVEAAQ